MKKTGLQGCEPGRRRAIGLAAAATLSTMAAGTMTSGRARAAAFPDRPIRLLVGYSAGGGVDAAARLLAAQLAGLLGQQVVVENRTGATGLIAAETLAASPADGHHLMLADSALLIARQLQPKAGLDPLANFRPVCGAFIAPLMIVATNGLPASTPGELVELLKAQSGRLSYATSGIGTVHHLGFATLLQATGSEATHVPYRGASQLLPDVIGGQIPLAVVSAAAGMSQARAGKLKALALMNRQPLAGAEKVQAMAGAVSGFDVAPRLFLLAPANTPQPVVERLASAVRQALQVAEVATAATEQGLLLAWSSPDETARALREEDARWKQLIADQGIKAEAAR